MNPRQATVLTRIAVIVGLLSTLRLLTLDNTAARVLGIASGVLWVFYFVWRFWPTRPADTHHGADQPRRTEPRR